MTIWRSFRLVALLFLAVTADAASPGAKIKKVLPHFLDQQGRHMIHPSLFERDNYQAELRLHPERCGGMRFDTQWKASALRGQDVRMKLEVRGSKLPPRMVNVFEGETKRAGRFSQWTSAKLSGEDYQRIGSVIAWRVTLWAGETQIAEQRSFLW